jgi:hypothetical protein
MTGELDATVVSRVGAITRVAEPAIIEEPASSFPDVETSVAQQPAPAVDPFPESQPLPPRSPIPLQPVDPPEPKLSLTFDGADRATVGREWTAVFTISNTGDADARNVAVDIMLPEHLRHRHGSSVRHWIANLAAGESRTARLIVVAESAGHARFSADLSLAGTHVDRKRIELQIEAGVPISQASHEWSPRREPPQPCSPSMILQPLCVW